MAYSFDYSKIKLENLRESGLYDEELLEDLKNERFETLRGLGAKGEDENFIRPILYAMINEYNFYEVYIPIVDKVKLSLMQNDYTLSLHIMEQAPQVIENSPLAENKDLILTAAEKNPEVIKYISTNFKEDKEFLGSLVKSSNSEIIKIAIEKYSIEKLIEAEPSLANDATFMIKALSKDASVIECMSEEMLNNYEVFMEASKNSEEVIDYVIEHSDKLGDDAIRGVKVGVIERVDEMLEKTLTKEEKESKKHQRREKFKENNKENAKVRIDEIISKENMTEKDLKEAFRLAEIVKEDFQRKLAKNEVELNDFNKFVPTPGMLKSIFDQIPLKNDVKFIEELKMYKKSYNELKSQISKEKEQKMALEVHAATILPNKIGIGSVERFGAMQNELPRDVSKNITLEVLKNQQEISSVDHNENQTTKKEKRKIEIDMDIG